MVVIKNICQLPGCLHGYQSLFIHYYLLFISILNYIRWSFRNIPPVNIWASCRAIVANTAITCGCDYVLNNCTEIFDHFSNGSFLFDWNNKTGSLFIQAQQLYISFISFSICKYVLFLFFFSSLFLSCIFEYDCMYIAFSFSHIFQIHMHAH